MFPQAEEGGLETEELSQEVGKRKAKLRHKYQGGKNSSGHPRKKVA
jgi:hypothetical protein